MVALLDWSVDEGKRHVEMSGKPAGEPLFVRNQCGIRGKDSARKKRRRKTDSEKESRKRRHIAADRMCIVGCLQRTRNPRSALWIFGRGHIRVFEQVHDPQRSKHVDACACRSLDGLKTPSEQTRYRVFSSVILAGHLDGWIHTTEGECILQEAARCVCGPRFRESVCWFASREETRCDTIASETFFAVGFGDMATIVLFFHASRYFSTFRESVYFSECHPDLVESV